MDDKPYKLTQLEGGLNVVEYKGKHSDIKIIQMKEGDLVYIEYGHRLDKITKDTYISYKPDNHDTTDGLIFNLIGLVIVFSATALALHFNII